MEIISRKNLRNIMCKVVLVPKNSKKSGRTNDEERVIWVWEYQKKTMKLLLN